MKSLIFKKVSSFEKELIEKIFRLRFEVYALQCGFINEKDYPHGLEQDFYDEYSLHFGAFDPLGEVHGSVRMIMPNPKGYPIYQHVDPYLLTKVLPSGAKAAEISRLVISKRFGRKENLARRDQNFRRGVRPLFSAKGVTFKLCEQLTLQAIENNVTHVFALMERSLLVLLHKYGFEFNQFADPVDVFGMVYPCVADTNQIARALLEHSPQEEIPLTLALS